jgi:flagellar biosynthesis protein FlhF
MPEALEKIRVELGKDAIILNSKPIKRGGFFGLFGKQQIEVIAAVDGKPPERAKAEPVRQTETPFKTANAYAMKQAYQKTAAAAGMPSPHASAVSNASEQVSVTTLEAPRSRSAPPEADVRSAARMGKEADKAKAESSQIANELRDMREMFHKLLLLKESSSNMPGPLLAIRNRLLQQEVEEELVAQIVKEMLFLTDDPNALTEPEAYQQASGIIQGMIKKASPAPARIDRSVKYAFLFGPTGVGKTTTIAKIAAEAMLKERRKVGFITSDTYRIAAVEQLKTYANILNVPLEVVFSPKEIGQAMERLSACDLVLVDTAGRNYRNDEYVRGIKELLRHGETIANFLVLSLTTKFADMKAILDNFRDLPGGRAIFTKADETDVYGSMLNVTQCFDLTLSYITTGQNVPDDITLASPELVTNMILGDDSYA